MLNWFKIEEMTLVELLKCAFCEWWRMMCNTWWHYCNSTRKVWHRWTTFCTLFQMCTLSLFCPEQVICILSNTGKDRMVWISLFPVINEHLEHFLTTFIPSCIIFVMQILLVSVQILIWKTVTVLLRPLLTVEIFQVLQAFARAEKKLKPNWKEMFTEVLSTRFYRRILCVYLISIQVYDEIPTDLQKQMAEMEKHVEMYKDQYPLKVFIPYHKRTNTHFRYSFHIIKVA